MATATRELTFLLAEPERRLLRSIARLIPLRFNSNHLTVLGVIGAFGTGAAYALSGLDIRWLWVASLMLAVNWFGDSLDGTLARVRKAERPRYGYYLDHFVDAFATTAIGVGIGLSPFVSLPVALVLVVFYLALSINVYLESQVFGVFKLAYGKIGPTEARIILILVNSLLVFVSHASAVPAWIVPVLGNSLAALLAVGMAVTLAVRFGKNLSRLARLEPRNRVARAASLG